MSQNSMNTNPGPKKHQPYVPENAEMKEFTLRAVLLGLFMTVVLGAANAYLGLRAGITIAATYPAAVIAMAVLRAWKGSLLEENIARTAGSIGESVAAGAIFTIPAFLIAKAWPSFRPADAYWKSTALMMVGSVLGRAFCFAGAAGDGGRSGTSLSGIGGGASKFIKPDSAAPRRRNIFSGTSAWAAWCTCWAVLGCLPPTKIFSSASAIWAAARFDWARRAARILLPTGGTSMVSRAQRESGVSGRRLHYRTAAGVHSICRRRVGLGLDGSAADVFSGAATEALSSCRYAGQLGGTWRRRYGDSLCGPSPWAECWWARPTRCTKCARA